jgi:hypothetical protein
MTSVGMTHDREQTGMATPISAACWTRRPAMCYSPGIDIRGVKMNCESSSIWGAVPLVAVSLAKCTRCSGTGYIQRSKQPCGCALRGMFDEVWAVFEEVHEDCSSSYVTAEGRWMFGRKREEFAADVLAVSRRTLQFEEWRLFEMHHFRSKPWSECIGPLQLSRGNFFHAVYRVKEELGRAWAEAGLWPVRSYFACRHLPDLLSTRQARAGRIRNLFQRIAREQEWKHESILCSPFASLRKPLNQAAGGADATRT